MYTVSDGCRMDAAKELMASAGKDVEGLSQPRYPPNSLGSGLPLQGCSNDPI